MNTERAYSIMSEWTADVETHTYGCTVGAHASGLMQRVTAVFKTAIPANIYMAAFEFNVDTDRKTITLISLDSLEGPKHNKFKYSSFEVANLDGTHVNDNAHHEHVSESVDEVGNFEVIGPVKDLMHKQHSTVLSAKLKDLSDGEELNLLVEVVRFTGNADVMKATQIDINHQHKLITFNHKMTFSYINMELV